ncbi:MAG: helix-turn-helix transcriptional regulator [Bdellovibrionaceae bacterium]|nr:helix-turn-helix transcriptional regulator [Pseudobdellovibrionaceae bacterium]
MFRCLMLAIGAVLNFAQSRLTKARAGVLKMIHYNIGQELKINERFGLLLLGERKNSGRSVRYIARRFRISRRNIQRWEQGLSSPPAKVFYRLIQHYGLTAVQRAQILDLEIQLEKYEMVKRRTAAEAAQFSDQTEPIEMPMLVAG